MQIVDAPHSCLDYRGLHKPISGISRIVVDGKYLDAAVHHELQQLSTHHLGEGIVPLRNNGYMSRIGCHFVYDHPAKM